MNYAFLTLISADSHHEEINRPWPLVRDFVLNRIKWNTRISRSEFVTYDSILDKNSDFYRKLSPDNKAKVMHRVVAFIRTKKFVGHGLELTEEMKVLIAYSAIKLTFGFQHYVIPHLNTIHVATSAFYTPMLKAHAKGLTSENGTMYLAWDSVVEGFADENDGLHLAVHEMAHALKIDTIKGSPAKERFAFYLNTWLEVAEKRRAKSDNSFLRAYGKSNLHEFFAVCMENFVERPDEFYKNEPFLFAHTCFLLNQFPLEPKNRELNQGALDSLAKRTGASFPKPSDKDYTHHSWHWSLTMLLASIFLAPIFIGVLTYDVIMPIDGWAFYFIFCGIAGALFYKPVVKYKVMELGIYIVFVLAGGGPTLYSGALLVDRVIPIQRWEETARVVKATPNLHEGIVKVVFEDNQFAEWPQLQTQPIENMKHFRNHDDIKVHLQFKRGVLGIIKLSDHHYTYNSSQ